MVEKQIGKDDMPDFKQLDDRHIANATNEPIFVIKTNLDPKNPTEDNPYYKEGLSDKEKFTSYFEDNK